MLNSCLRYVETVQMAGSMGAERGAADCARALFSRNGASCVVVVVSRGVFFSQSLSDAPSFPCRCLPVSRMRTTIVHASLMYRLVRLGMTEELKPLVGSIPHPP